MSRRDGSTYVLRGIPPELIARARQRAQDEGTTLAAVIGRYLTTYAAHGSIQSSGGHARKLSLTPEQRRESARHAALARWQDHQRDPSE
jgi:hypothetical protein